MTFCAAPRIFSDKELPAVRAGLRNSAMAFDDMDNDDAVIRDVLAGNVDAFGILVRRYQRPIFNLMRRTTGRDETAEDLAQDTFVRAYENLDRFRLDARFFPWLYAIGVNRARDWLRSAGVRRHLACDAPDAPWASAGCENPQPRLDERLDLPRVWRAVAQLPFDYREALVLRYREDLSFKEVAQALGIALSAAKMRVHRGLEMVRGALEVNGDDQRLAR